MFDYIIRRLLLMIPTFFGTTLLVFVILQSVPSGPFEQAVMQIKLAKMQSSDEGGTASETNDKGGIELSEKVLEKLRMQFGLDKPVWKRYLIWLGLAEKEIEYKEVEWGIPFRYTIENLGQGKYTASKAGEIAMSKRLANDYAKKNITVNCVSPGFIKTNMTDNISEKFKSELISRIPMNRLGTGEDISNTIAFLSSESSSYITGETIHVNGGMYMA